MLHLRFDGWLADVAATRGILVVSADQPNTSVTKKQDTSMGGPWTLGKSYWAVSRK